MKFQKQNTPQTDFLNSDSDGRSCPLLNIPLVTEHGMVLETRCGFEIGSTIALGFHLQFDEIHVPTASTIQEEADLPVKEHSGQEGSVFISVEVIVVESMIGTGTAGQPVYLVTVLFSQISRKDREQLLRYSGSHSAHRQVQSSALVPLASAPWDSSEKLLREATQRIYLN